MRPTDPLHSLDRDGFAIVPDVIPPERVRDLIASLEAAPPDDALGAAPVALERNRARYAMRNLLDVPAIRDLATSHAFRAVVDPILGPRAFPVRGILFDKTPGANWKVAWHQDLSIAVRERVDAGGFGPWSSKAGVVHVQPPVGVLRSMVTLRLHLDPCGEENGPLRVLPGSHAEGVLDAESQSRWRRRAEPVCCVVGAGGLVVMRPLILHASSAATTPSHRRVVHLEFAAGALPGGLDWRYRPSIIASQ